MILIGYMTFAWPMKFMNCNYPFLINHFRFRRKRAVRNAVTIIFMTMHRRGDDVGRCFVLIHVFLK